MRARAIRDDGTRRIGLWGKVLLASIAAVAIGAGVSLFARRGNDVGTCIANALSMRHLAKDSIFFFVNLGSLGTVEFSQVRQDDRTFRELPDIARIVEACRVIYAKGNPGDERIRLADENATISVRRKVGRVESAVAGAQVSLRNGKGGSCVTDPQGRCALSLGGAAVLESLSLQVRLPDGRIIDKAAPTLEVARSGLTIQVPREPRTLVVRAVSCNDQSPLRLARIEMDGKGAPIWRSDCGIEPPSGDRAVQCQSAVATDGEARFQYYPDSLESVRAVVSPHGGNGAPESHVLDSPLDDIAIVRWGCPCVVQSISITQPKPGEGSNGDQLTIGGQVHVEGAGDPSCARVWLLLKTKRPSDGPICVRRSPLEVSPRGEWSATVPLGEQGQSFGETFRIRAVANSAATRWEPTIPAWPKEGAQSALLSIVKSGGPTDTRLADDLIDVIRKEQSSNVRESSGEWADQCFTEADLARFWAQRIPTQIVASLSTDQDFGRIADAIRAMPTDQRRQLLGKAARTYHPTWAQLGRKDSSGQTEAGQTAERAIAARITDLARKRAADPGPPPDCRTFWP